MSGIKECKHEWRQSFQSEYGNSGDRLMFPKGFYCIHCLLEVNNKQHLDEHIKYIRRKRIHKELNKVK